MIQYMQEMKQKRLKREYDQLVVDRKVFAVEVLRQYKLEHQNENKVMPEPPDFCSFETIKSILERPADVEVSTSSFDEIIPLLPDIIEAWRTRIEGELFKHLTEKPISRSQSFEDILMMDYDSDEEDWASDDESLSYVSFGPELESNRPNDPHYKMRLAMTVLRCSGCSSLSGTQGVFTDFFLGFNSLFDDSEDTDIENPTLFRGLSHRPLFYPYVMGHSCCTKDTRPAYYRPPQRDVSIKLDSIPGVRQPWTAHRLGIDKRASEAMWGIIRACGLDPDEATAEDLNQLDPRLACMRCATRTKGVDENHWKAPTFGWISAVRFLSFNSKGIPH